MFYTVYKVTNGVNGKSYTGKHQTDDLNDGYMGSGKYLKRAIEKHGLDKFRKEILFVFDNEQEMNEKEKELVVISEQTYNLCEGGQGGFGYINRTGKNVYPGCGKDSCGEQNLIIWREVFRNKIKDDGEFRKKFSEAVKKSHRHLKTFLGKSHKEESKQKIGAANAIHQSGSGNSQYGKPRSPEVKAKIAASMKRYRSNKNYAKLV